MDRRWGRWAALVVTTVVFTWPSRVLELPLLVVVAGPIALAFDSIPAVYWPASSRASDQPIARIVLLLGLTGTISLP